MDKWCTKLKIEREKAKITRSKLSDKTGIDRRRIAKIESGGDVTVSELNKILNVFGYDLVIMKRDSMVVI